MSGTGDKKVYPQYPTENSDGTAGSYGSPTVIENPAAGISLSLNAMATVSITYGTNYIDPNLAETIKAYSTSLALPEVDIGDDTGGVLGVAGFTYIHDTGSNWVRTRSLPSDSDGQAAALSASFGFLGVTARLQAFNGSTFDRIRTASAANVSAATQIPVLTSGPGEWSVNHTPVANTQATIGRAAVASSRNVCRSISANIIGESGAAATTVLLNLRDGATGAGTILWSQRLLVIASGMTGISISGLNIVGSVNTAMTLEFAAAGGANTFESVAMTGFTVA